MAYATRRNVGLMQYLHHSLLSLISSRTYVDAIISCLPEGCLHLSTSVISAESTESNRVLLTTSDMKKEEYDHVILACHSDTSLAILKAGGISKDEQRILSGFQWNGNEVVVHSDKQVNSLPTIPNVDAHYSSSLCQLDMRPGHAGTT